MKNANKRIPADGKKVKPESYKLPDKPSKGEPPDMPVFGELPEPSPREKAAERAELQKKLKAKQPAATPIEAKKKVNQPSATPMSRPFDADYTGPVRPRSPMVASPKTTPMPTPMPTTPPRPMPMQQLGTVPSANAMPMAPQPVGGAPAMKRGGSVRNKPAAKFSSGGSTNKTSSRGDGIAQRGKTKGRYI